MTAPHVSEPQDWKYTPEEVVARWNAHRTAAPRIPLWAWALSGVLLAIAACWAVWRWE